MRKLCFAFISIWLLTLTAFAQGPSRVAVMAYTNGNLITPTNFFASNLLAGANVSISIGASGKVTIATIATNVVSTNFAALFVTNFVEGTNYTWYFATNVPRGIVTFEWLTNLLSTVGTNVAMLTNGNQFQGVPLSIKAGFLTTNANIYPTSGDSGTNIVIHLNNASTRTEPILQIIDDTSGNATFTIGDDSQLNGNGYGLSNLNGVAVMPGTINSNAIDAALDALYRAGSLAVTTNYVHGAIQTYVGLNATNVFVGASTFHTNWANAVSNLTVSLILTNSTNIIYVSPRGNDATWVRGRQGRPCSTLSNAVFWSRAGDTIVMEPGWYTNYSAFHARVHSNAPVLLTNKTDLTILADGAIMYWPTGMVTGLLFYQSSNITVRGLSLVNNRTNLWPLPKVATNDYVGTGGFGQAEVIDSVDIRFWDCRFIGSFDHGILTDSTRPGDYPYKSTFAATNCEIRSCTALDCGQWDAGGWWDGAGFVVSHGWRVTGNYIHGASVGVEYYPLEDGQHRPGAVIVGNISVDTVIGYAVKYGRPIVSGNQYFWTGTHGLTNYMGLGSMGIRCDVTDGGLISDNLFQGNVFGVFLVSCTNLTIADNQIIGGARALHMDSASRLKVAGNTSRDTWQYGFMLATGKLLDSEFSHNTWENCGTNNAPYDINYFGDNTTASNLTFTSETIRGDFPMPRSITLGTAVTSTNIILQDNLFPAAPSFPVSSLLHERSTNRVKMLLSATPGQVWTATNSDGFGTWSNVAPASVSSNGTLVVSTRTTNLNFIAGNVNTDILVSNNPSGQANIIISASLPGGGGDQFSGGSMLLSNAVGNPATGWTNTLYGSASVTFTTNSGGTVQLTASGSPVGTNFYNAEVSNSVRSLNGFFTNLTVYSDFTVSNLSAVSFTLSNIAPGLAYFSTADTNLASLPTGSVGKILMATNGSSQYAWVDMPPVTNGPNWTVAGGNWGHPAAVVINFNDTTNMPWSIMCSKPSDTLTIDFNAMTDGRIIQWSNTYLGLTFDGYSAYTNSGSVAFAGDMGVKSNLTVAGNLTVNGTNSVTEAEFGTLTVTNAVNLGTTYVARFIISNVTAGVAYFDSSYILTNLAHATGVLTNNASGVMGWGTPFVNADTTVSNGLVGWTVSGPSNTLASATTATTNGLVAWVVSGPSNTLSSATTATTNGLVAWVVSGPSNTLRTDLSAAITAHTNLPQASVNTLDVTNNVSYLVGTSNALDNTGLTNISLNFNQGAMRIYATNSLILTNCVGLEAGEGTREKNLTLSVVVSTVGSVTNMFPTLGADSTGVHFYTNANNYVSTTLTNVGRHIYTLRAVGTNVNITYTHWK